MGPRRGMLRWIAVALGLLVLGGCTGSGDVRPDRGEAGTVYRAPAGAPEFCTLLAGSGRVDDIPSAVGRLQLDPAGTGQAYRLTSAGGEFEEVRDSVRREGRHPGLEAALGELVDALTVAAAGTLTEDEATRIAEGLDAVGRESQAVCRFPV